MEKSDSDFQSRAIRSRRFPHFTFCRLQSASINLEAAERRTKRKTRLEKSLIDKQHLAPLKVIDHLQPINYRFTPPPSSLIRRGEKAINFASCANKDFYWISLLSKSGKESERMGLWQSEVCKTDVNYESLSSLTFSFPILKWKETSLIVWKMSLC